MKFKEVTLFGATGLIGGYLLKTLLKDSNIHLINIVGRKPFYLKHDKINSTVVDFTDINSLSNCINKSEVVYVSIGTTMKRVNGNKSEYRKVDFDIIYNIAKACKQKSVNHLLFVSSLGANPKANSFYLSLKGEIENSIHNLELNCTSVFRPSVLIGKRSETRLGESIAQTVMSSLSFAIPSKYKPIKAEDVAKSMINVSKKNKPGFHLYHYNEIKNNLY